MNRQIKFRGKRLDNGEWVYGHYADYIHPDCGLPSPSIIYMIPNCGNMIVAIDPSTVGQFTGLLDRNGKEIYEGDIINSPCMNIVVVEFGYHEDVVRLKGMPFNDSFAAYGWIVRNLENGTSGLLDNSFLQGEIIGNIHDNQELLNPAKP